MRRLASLVPLLLVLLVPGVAGATQVEAMTLRELVLEADLVVVGTVVSSESHYDDLDRIVTDATIRVEDTLHGARRETIVLRQLGGVVGDIGLAIAGEGSYPVGARTLLFLRALTPTDLPEGSVVFRPLGMSQGVMPMIEAGGVEVVMPGGADVSIVTRRADGSLVPADAALTAPAPRDAFLGRVRDLVSEVHGE
jgi:hypothetical protein